MNRRGFLRLLGSSLSAAYALTALPVDGFDAIVYESLPTIGPIDVVDFRTATLRVARAMHAAFGPVPQMICPIDPRIGQCLHLEDTNDILTVTDQFTIGPPGCGATRGPQVIAMPRLDYGDVLDAATLDAYGEQLAQIAKAHRIRAFAPMVLPGFLYEGHNARYQDGPTVRGVIGYDIQTDGLLYRFDVLGARG